MIYKLSDVNKDLVTQAKVSIEQHPDLSNDDLIGLVSAVSYTRLTVAIELLRHFRPDLDLSHELSVLKDFYPDDEVVNDL